MAGKAELLGQEAAAHTAFSQEAEMNTGDLLDLFLILNGIETATCVKDSENCAYRDTLNGRPIEWPFSLGPWNISSSGSMGTQNIDSSSYPLASMDIISRGQGEMD